MRIKVISCLICVMMFSVYFIAEPTEMVSATTIIVPDHYPKIQNALDAANQGDIIYVRAGNYYENIYINKTVILQGEDNVTTVIDGGCNGDVINIQVDWVNISGFTIINSGSSSLNAGLRIKSDNNLISQNIFSNNQYGILLESCSRNKIIGNKASSNNQIGISLTSSNDNLVEDNLVSHNYCGISLYLNCNNNTIIGNHAYESQIGISLSFYGSNNTIISNKAWSNRYEGIALVYKCNNNIIANNNVSKNGQGISLWDRCNDNNIFNNIILHNSWGVYTGLIVQNNIIYHNNIIDNFVNDPSNAWNHWYHPVLLEGNYWSNYKGVDDGSGSGKHAIAGDGIGDTLIPYPKKDYDLYPLMRPWIPIITSTIDIDPNTLNLKSKGRWITCYITLNNSYDVNDIDISTMILENVIPAEWGDIQNDTLMVKFDRSDMEDMLSPGTYNLKVTGELADGTSFEGYSDEIRVIDPGK